MAWTFGSFIIVQIVTGILRSNTAVKRPVKLLDTFQDIVDDPKLEPVAWAGTPTMITLEEKRGEVIRKINERMRQMGTLVTLDKIFNDETFNKILDGKAVFLQEPESMLIDIPPLCDKYNGFFHLNAKDNVQSELVWFFSSKLDKETQMAYSIRTMWTFEAGVRWIREREVIPVPPKCFTFAIRAGPMGGDNESFSMEHLLPFFFILFIGY
ncbi:hypothetical protein BIW11_10682, partial [Tropilaelaps mercedesae]